MTVLNSALVRWAKGYKTATDATSVGTYGRREGFLSLSQVEEETSVAQAAAPDRAAIPAVQKDRRRPRRKPFRAAGSPRIIALIVTRNIDSVETIRARRCKRGICGGFESEAKQPQK